MSKGRKTELQSEIEDLVRRGMISPFGTDRVATRVGGKSRAERRREARARKNAADRLRRNVRKMDKEDRGEEE